MALTPQSLAVALRVVAEEDQYTDLETGQQSVIARLLKTAVLLVNEYAGGAPEDIRDEATVRTAGFLYDSSAQDTRGQNPLRSSGAQALLSQWHTVRLATATGVAAATPESTIGGRIAGVSEQLVAVKIAEHAARSNAHHNPPDTSEFQRVGDVQAALNSRIPEQNVERIPRPPGGNNLVWKTGANGEAPAWRPDATADPGTGGTDETAREAAAEVAATLVAHAADESAHHDEPDVDATLDARIPADAAARIPSGNPGNNRVWKTDIVGVPDWREDEQGTVGGDGGLGTQDGIGQPRAPRYFGEAVVTPEGKVFVAGKTETHSPGTAIAELHDGDSVDPPRDTEDNEPWGFSDGVGVRGQFFSGDPVAGWDPDYAGISKGLWRGFTDDPARLGKYSEFRTDSDPPPGEPIHLITNFDVPGFDVGADRVTGPGTFLDGWWCFYSPDRKFYQARFTGEYEIPSGREIYTIHSYTAGQCRAYVLSLGISLTVWEGIRYEGHFDSISDLANDIGNVAINELPRRLVILTTADGIRPDNGEPYAPGVYEVRYSQAGTPSSVNVVLFWTSHPPGTSDGSGVTPAFVDAKIAAHSAVAAAHHTLAPTEGQPGGSVIDVIDGRLPALPVAFRIGWSQSQAAVEGVFTRANDHPIDGAALGETDGLDAPPFPPSLASDSTLYLHLWIEGSPSVAALQTTQNVTAAFSVGVAFSVDGVVGTLFVSNTRYTDDGVGVSYRAVLVGALLATVEEVTAKLAEHASIANVHHTPPDEGEHIDQEARDAAAAASAVAMTAQTAAAAAQATADESSGVTIAQVGEAIQAHAAVSDAQVGEAIQAHAAVSDAHHVKTPAAQGGAVAWSGVRDFGNNPLIRSWTLISNTPVASSGFLVLMWRRGRPDGSLTIAASRLRELGVHSAGQSRSNVGATNEDEITLAQDFVLARTSDYKLLISRKTDPHATDQTFYFSGIFQL